jgi:hypothetical protein
LLGKDEGRVEKIYLSKGSLPDASEEDEVEKVDIGIKVNDLWEYDIGTKRMERGKGSEPEDDSRQRPWRSFKMGYRLVGPEGGMMQEGSNEKSDKEKED